MPDITVLGIFVADTAYTAERLPAIGETIFGSGFAIGPGGKGSNQAIAAAKAGASVAFISRLGKDTFGDLALRAYSDAGVEPRVVLMDDAPTGAAFIFVNGRTGDNAIIVSPGAANHITADDVDAQRSAIESSKIFITQLEQPLDAAVRGLEIARAAGVKTLFNPAPIMDLDQSIYPLCDYVVPNETEAAGIVGHAVDSLGSARSAGDTILDLGAKAVLITLGSRGVLYHTRSESVHVPAVAAGPVIDTTGAGDSFIGGFSAALARGKSPTDAVWFGCAAAGISVTRRGTAPAMPPRDEVEQLLAILSK